MQVPTTCNSLEKYCVIGAGAAGMAVCRAFLQHGIPFDCFEREDDVGGTFNYGKPNSVVYKSVHLISPRRLTEYPDYPMPSHWPHYPHHSLVMEYFRSYARHFDLYNHIRFNTSVDWAEPEACGWRVRLGNGCEQTYRGLIIANGHFWSPSYPNFPGEFSGETLHSKYYKTPDLFADKRVLVVGNGNTGCDIALDAVPVASKTMLSMRRSCYFMPKFFMGKPGGETLYRLGCWGVPLWIRRIVSLIGSYVINGRPQDYGLPAPEHRLFDTNLTVNSLIPYRIAHGDIHAKPNVAALEGDRVRFTDGTTEEVDVLVYATGYDVSIPFVQREHLNWRDGIPRLFMQMLHPRRDDLAIVGLFNSISSGHWGLMHYQAQLLARWIFAKDSNCDIGWFQRMKSETFPNLRGGFATLDTPRNRLTVDPIRFRRQLERLIREFQLRHGDPARQSADAPSSLRNAA